MLQYILLGLLNYAPMTGYELKSIIDESTTHFWHAYHSQIYTMLRKLEGDGLLTSESDDADDKLNRRVYHLTDAGHAALLAWQGQPLTELPAIKDDLLVRLFFSGLRDRADVIDELRVQKLLHQRKLEYYEALAGELIARRVHSKGGAGIDLTSEARYWMATLRFGEQYERMYIAWLESVIAELEVTG